MKRIFLSLLISLSLLFSGCSTVQLNAVKTFLNRPEAKATISILEEQAKQYANSIVKSVAVNAKDIKNKEDFFHSIAQGLRENAPSIESGATTVEAVVNAWAQDRPHWKTLAGALGGLYAELPADKKGIASLEALAVGLQNAAQ